MKQLITFIDGTRTIGDTSALVLNQHPSNIETQQDLTHATPTELQSLVQNPHNDELLKTIANRGKIKI